MHRHFDKFDAIKLLGRVYMVEKETREVLGYLTVNIKKRYKDGGGKYLNRAQDRNNIWRKSE